MTPKEKAQELILRFYYLLPNNGFHKEGINSCDSRYKEAINCAWLSVDEMLYLLEDEETMSDVYYFYVDVNNEIEKIKQEYE